MAKQFRLNTSREIIVDLFAGGGGASLGIEMATGRMVDIAINHDPEAIAMHMANHPVTRHLRADIREVDPAQATGGWPVGLLWASPDCKHHSKAKGGKPRDNRIRSLAWVVIRWAKTVKPRVICLENVEEFKDWGPLDAQGHPIKTQKGKTFSIWRQRLEHLGYHVESRELRACDYGAPTIRKRLFVIARRDGLPIVWPDPTHGTGPGLKPYRSAAECIDWTLPCPSIFERTRPLADSTQRRIVKGIQRYVVNTDTPFIVGQTVHNLIHMGHGEQSANGHGRFSHGIRDLREPLNTVTASGVPAGLVTAHIATYYGDKRPHDVRGTDLRGQLGTQTTENRHALVTAFLAKHYGGNCTNPASSLQAPAPTVTAIDHTSLVTSNLIKLRGDNTGQDVRAPLATVSAQGTHHAEVRAFLVKYYGTGEGQKIDDPVHTVTTKDRYGLVTIQGQDYAVMDIGLRMLQPRELFRAQGFPDDYIIDRGADGRPLTKTAQVRMCGNSVCPPVAAAIVAANYQAIELMERAA